jgi:adenosylcobinamide-phosphate synthase
MLAAATILLAAVLVDAAIGDPVYRWHPVRLMGRVIHHSEAVLRKFHLSGFVGGMLLLIVMLTLCAGGGYFFLVAVRHTGVLFEGACAVFLLYSCIALSDLGNHAGPVAKNLIKKDLTLARLEVQKMVGRDAGRLDERGVAQAAVESVAEGFVDGFLSPLFCFSAGAVLAALAQRDPVAAGTAAALAFRAANTLDSMVGYRNERYRRFGSASARLDDLLNFMPARLAIPILTLAARLNGLNAGACWRIGLRDRLKHASPNAGHAESCVAGALGLRLGGPTIYAHGTVDKPSLGDGSGRVDAESIASCCRLIRLGGWLSLFFFFTLLLALHLAGL